MAHEDQKKGKELLRLSKQYIKYDIERPEFLPEYRNISIGLEQSLNKVHDDMINSLLYSVPTFYMAKEEVNAMFGVPKFEYKKIIFNGPCTIILWKDGTKTIAKTSGEIFDPEKGVAICFMKRALGDTEGKKVLREYSNKYKEEQVESGWECKFSVDIDPKDLHPLKTEEYRLYFDGHTEHINEINKSIEEQIQKYGEDD